jgi:hypothetical protein
MAVTPLNKGQVGTSAMNERIAEINTDIDAVATDIAAITPDSYTVATLPDADENTGRVLYVSDGSAGDPCAAISDGTNWKVIAIGATVATE